MTRLGVLLPAILVAFPCVDLALRWGLPRGTFAFRGWESSLPARWPAPFGTNSRWSSPRAFGDLANVGNRPDLRLYRPEDFHTDALGCRNEPRWAIERKIDALFVGSSFIAGSGLDDAHTIPALLSVRTGRRVYNAGGSPHPAHELIDRIADHFGFKRGQVFREILMRQNFIEMAAGPPESPAPLTELVTQAPFMGQSPVKILARRAVRALENDRLLPNLDASRVMIRKRASGPAELFYPIDARLPRPVPRDPLTDWLTARGYTVTIVLLPNKFQVYRPYLENEAPADGPVELAIAEVEAGYRAAGYTVLNMFRPLRAAAAADDPPVFWPDDSHVAPRGAGIIAAEVARTWPR